MKLEEHIKERLAAGRKKPSGATRYITGSLREPVFPSLEKRASKAPATLPGLGPLPSTPATVGSPVNTVGMSAAAPEPADTGMDAFSLYERNTPVGW